MENSQTLKPIQANQRVIIIDILRGWALLGIIFMNFSDFFADQIDPETYNPSLSDSILMYFFHILFSTKCWTLLAILFGVGFTIFYEKAKTKVDNINLFFIKRMFILLVFGLINSTFYGGDILLDYAVIGMIMLPFIHLKPKTLFLISIGIFLISPALVTIFDVWYPMPKFDYEYYKNLNESTSLLDVFKANLYMRYNTFLLLYSYAIIVHLIQLAGFLLGIAAAKTYFFENLNTASKPKIKKIFWISLTVTLLAYVAVIFANKYGFTKFYSTRYVLAVPTMIFTTSAVCWLFISNKLKSFFSALQIIGKMTLTSYVVQNLIAFIVFVLLKPALPLYAFYCFALIVFILQVYFSKWWLSKYNYGPLEWLWRSLSYGKWFDFKKE